MNKGAKVNSCGLEEILKLFEDNISIADINAARYLGKISAAIVKKRTEWNMTQQEFAKHINVSQAMVSKWEGGDYNFSVKALAEIAEKLDLELYINLKSPRNKSDEITGLKEQMYVCGVSPKPQYKKSAKSNIIQFVDKKSYVDKQKNSVYSHELSEM